MDIAQVRPQFPDSPPLSENTHKDSTIHTRGGPRRPNQRGSIEHGCFFDFPGLFLTSPRAFMPLQPFWRSTGRVVPSPWRVPPSWHDAPSWKALHLLSSFSDHLLAVRRLLLKASSRPSSSIVLVEAHRTRSSPHATSRRSSASPASPIQGRAGRPPEP